MTPGTSSGYPAASHDSLRDVARLWADGVDAAGDHIVDRTGIDVDPVEKAAPARGSQIHRMHTGKRSVSLADSGAHGFDDVCLSHFWLLLW